MTKPAPIPAPTLNDAIQRQRQIQQELQALSDQHTAARERAETLQRQEAKAAEALNMQTRSLKSEHDEERVQEAWTRGIDLAAMRQTVADLDAAGTEAEAEAKALRERMKLLQDELTAVSAIPASADDVRKMIKTIASDEAKRVEIVNKLQETENTIGEFDRELLSRDEANSELSGKLAALSLGELTGKRAEQAASEIERTEAEGLQAAAAIRQRKNRAIALAAGLRTRLAKIDGELEQHRQELGSLQVRFMQAKVDAAAAEFTERAEVLAEQHRHLCGLAALLERLPEHPRAGGLCRGAPRIPITLPLLNYPGSKPADSARAHLWSDQYLNFEVERERARQSLPDGLGLKAG